MLTLFPLQITNKITSFPGLSKTFSPSKGPPSVFRFPLPFAAVVRMQLHVTLASGQHQSFTVTPNMTVSDLRGLAQKAPVRVGGG